MNYSFNGIGQETVTVPCSADIAPGTPCSMDLNGGLVAAAKDTDFFGILLTLRDGTATVIYRGFVTVSYQDAVPPSTGNHIIVSSGEGGVRMHSQGSRHQVVSVDNEASTITILL